VLRRWAPWVPFAGHPPSRSATLDTNENRVACLLVVHLFGGPPCQDHVYAIKAARLFDGVNDRLMEPGLVVVSKGKIESVGGAVPAGATVIDLGDATLLPGFIDAHTHLSMEFNPDYNADMLSALRRPVTEQAIRATTNARNTLMAGFTTVRDVARAILSTSGYAMPSMPESCPVRACWLRFTRSVRPAATATTPTVSASTSSAARGRKMV